MKHIHLALGALWLIPSILLAADSSTPPKSPAPKADPAFAPVTDVPGLPRVLLLGDSISIGYTPEVRKLLQGKANVHRPKANCSSTGYGLTNLASWLGGEKWDVIHFNFGVHDAKLPPEGIRHAPPDVYEKNLRELVARLKATGAKLIWASSTPIPSGGVLAPDRRFGDINEYNEIAKKIMLENSVAIDDLNAAATPRMNEILNHRTDAQGKVHWDLHFTPEGYALLAQHVAASIEQAVAKP
jgi:lysophospholipase L1-like esterase